VTAGPVVVLVLSHRDPPLVHRLVRRLTAGSNTTVVIHHDPTGPPLQLPRSDAVLQMPNPQHGAWGRLGFPLAVLNGLQFAVTRVPDLSWLLVISGQDYPTRPIRAIEAELSTSTVDASLRHFRVDRSGEHDVHPWQQVTRRRYLHKIRVPLTPRSVPFPRRHLFGQDLALYVGDVWVNLSSAAVHHILEQQERLPSLERYLNWCACPDEALLPTLLLNNAEHLRVEGDRWRYIRWTKTQPHPAFLEPSDVDKAVGGTELFARKVDTERTPDVLDMFDRLAGV
jgi:hypothetical protein